MTKSNTVKEKSFVENIVGSDGHYKTTISDNDRSVSGHADTSEKSQSMASKKWNK